LEGELCVGITGMKKKVSLMSQRVATDISLKMET